MKLELNPEQIDAIGRWAFREWLNMEMRSMQPDWYVFNFDKKERWPARRKALQKRRLLLKSILLDLYRELPDLDFDALQDKKVFYTKGSRIVDKCAGAARHEQYGHARKYRDSVFEDFFNQPASARLHNHE